MLYHFSHIPSPRAIAFVMERKIRNTPEKKNPPEISN
jgi:hypothetical protein